jgi:hypothetical protein
MQSRDDLQLAGLRLRQLCVRPSDNIKYYQQYVFVLSTP